MALIPGAHLGPYEVVAPLGAGGMGEVYRARDPRLGRDVAIKVLPDSVAGDRTRLDRFAREARAVAALSHPNILAVFDVGTGTPPYLVTELLEGETLGDLVARGPVTPKVAIDVFLQLVAGLAAAHARGIVHRDLKPANVFLTRDGIVKILDFGLAKVETVDPCDVDLTRDATLAGTLLGTAGYMSPEQVRGEPADGRSDIFAAGAILYELVSGQRAFSGRSVADTVSAVLREQPPALPGTGASASLARIVQRCLEKDPALRFQSASDVRSALDSAVGAPGAESASATDEASIAVLPFANMSADPENQYFSDGLADELINALSRLPGLRVASRTSAFRFRDGTVDIRQVGRDLQVSTVVEGSVRRAGPRLRVTAQLVNVADGYHRWSERYDREMADVFDIQDEIVQAIVEAIAPTLVPDARTAGRRPTRNLQAYEQYLKGRHHWYLRTPAAMQVAEQAFEHVIALDPDYALAWAGVADCLAIRRLYGWASAAEVGDRARQASARAMALDPTLAEVNFTHAAYIFFFEPEWRRAESFLRTAIAINPRFTVALAYLALLLTTDDRDDEALALVDRVRDADPLSSYAHYLVAMVYYTADRFADAEASTRFALELQPDAMSALWMRGLALSMLGQHQAAVETMLRVIAIARTPVFVGILGAVLARAGRTDEVGPLQVELDERRSRGEYISPIATLCLRLGAGDLPGVRDALDACIADATPFFSVAAAPRPLLAPYLPDSEVARLYGVLRDRPPEAIR